MSRILDNLEPPGRTPDGHVVVRVSDDDWVQAHFHGARRVTANLYKNDSPSYQNGHNAPERDAQIQAVLCEVAVARHLGLDFDWDLASWAAKDHHRFRDRADVGTNIEVRRVKYLNGRATVRQRQVGKGLYLFVAYAVPPEFLTVKILGWRPYDEAWDESEPAAYDKKNSGARTIDQASLWRCTCFADQPDGMGGHTCPPQQAALAPAA